MLPIRILWRWNKENENLTSSSWPKDREALQANENHEVLVVEIPFVLQGLSFFVTADRLFALALNHPKVSTEDCPNHISINRENKDLPFLPIPNYKKLYKKVNLIYPFGRFLFLHYFMLMVYGELSDILQFRGGIIILHCEFSRIFCWHNQHIPLNWSIQPCWGLAKFFQ